MSARADKAAASKAVSRCPICGQAAVRAHRPFCSKRCAEVDLGRWLKGQYAVPGEPAGGIDDRIDEERE